MCVMRLGRMRVMLCLVHMYVILLIRNKILSLISLDRLPKPWGDMTYSCVWDDLCASVYFMNHLYIWHHVFTKRNDLRDRLIHLQSLALIYSCVWHTCVIMHVCDITYAQDQNRWLMHNNKCCSTSLNELPKPSGDMKNICKWSDVWVRVTRHTYSMTQSQEQLLFQIAV